MMFTDPPLKNLRKGPLQEAGFDEAVSLLKR